MEIVQEGGGATVVRGHLPDQAALYGALLTLHRLGLTLLSLESSQTAQDEHV